MADSSDSPPKLALPEPHATAQLGKTAKGPIQGMTSPLAFPDDQPCPMNQTMFQGFEWYCPADHKHWARLQAAIPGLAGLGITSMWIPPATKAGWQRSNGYDTYDLYDLGEFDQKGARRTKWGTKEELSALVETANAHGVRILFDAVLNHKAAADHTESVAAVKVDPNDRTKVISKPRKIEAWTGFEFKGRGNAHSALKWNRNHFTGTDYDHKTKSKAVWRFQGKSWAKDVSHELGNYDFLMFADIDHSHPDVRQDLFGWGEWLGSQLELGGLRVDAVKHYSRRFLRDFVGHLDRTVGRDWFIVGEYWSEDSRLLSAYIEAMDHRISLFDVGLVANFSRVSMAARADLRSVFAGALCLHKPKNSVTFVTNHDTQAGQSLETPIAPYFVPMAYALILLRADAGLPCVFYGDLYGSLGRDNPSSSATTSRIPLPIPPTCGGAVLPRLVLARRLYAYGPQVDYHAHGAAEDCVGFARLGHPSRAGGAGLAVVVNKAWEHAALRMCVGARHAGQRWTDVLRWAWGEVEIGAGGWATFVAGPRSVAVWVDGSAEGRERLDGLSFDTDIYGLGEAGQPSLG